MKAIIVYPGKFQPPCKHHLAVYNHLVQSFGNSDVWIATSDKHGHDKAHPIPFSVKQRIFNLHGITLVQQVVNPYKPEEIVKKYPLDTILITAYGEKDAGRLSYVKSDGTLGYYQPFQSIEACKPYSEHGYVIVVPDSIGYSDKTLGKYTATKVREFLKDCTYEQYSNVMGIRDIDIFNILKSKV